MTSVLSAHLLSILTVTLLGPHYQVAVFLAMCPLHLLIWALTTVVDIILTKLGEVTPRREVTFNRKTIHIDTNNPLFKNVREDHDESSLKRQGGASSGDVVWLSRAR